MNVKVSASFLGGPLDGRRIELDEWEGCYWHRQGGEAHIYHRRYGYVVRNDKVISRSPQVYEHQPQLTRRMA